jgi:hypothetical protein
VSGRIGNPMRSARAKRERAAKLRQVVAAIDAGALAVGGVNRDGVEHTAERVRAELAAKIARLEERDG